jgi:hypothetical protein
MKRRKFIGLTASAVAAAAGVGYLISDKSNLTRSDLSTEENKKFKLLPDEQDILYLASLAPSGHNTQPWIVKYVEPYHWIIANDKTRWLPAVDPVQRETMLSLGAFLQNLEYAAQHYGYDCNVQVHARANQDENIMELRLVKSKQTTGTGIEEIKMRRTVRSGYLTTPLRADDLSYLTRDDPDFFHFVSRDSKEYVRLNELTIEANRKQAYREDAVKELADWIRFSNKSAKANRDGLTPAGMEINGIPGWLVRNFYGPSAAMKKSFREQSIDKVRQQVAASAGWMLISAKDSSVTSLIDTGKRLQRLLLKIRQRDIAIHPMTQVLEEKEFVSSLGQVTGVQDTVQFVLRTGYLEHYPLPVSLRRPVSWFLRYGEDK